MDDDMRSHQPTTPPPLPLLLAAAAALKARAVKKVESVVCHNLLSLSFVSCSS